MTEHFFKVPKLGAYSDKNLKIKKTTFILYQ